MNTAVVICLIIIAVSGWAAVAIMSMKRIDRDVKMMSTMEAALNINDKWSSLYETTLSEYRDRLVTFTDILGKLSDMQSEFNDTQIDMFTELNDFSKEFNAFASDFYDEDESESESDDTLDEVYGNDWMDSDDGEPLS